MSYVNLSQNRHVQGFNNYRLGSLRSQGMGGLMSYSNSLYGIPSRNGNGSWFNTAQGRSYNYGPVGTYYQFAEPAKPKDSWGKGLLNGVLASMIGFGPLGSLAAGWLSMNNNAEKAGNWISNLFKSGSDTA